MFIKKLFLMIFNFFFTLFWYVHFIVHHVWGIPFGITALFFGKRDFVSKATVWWTRNFFAFGGQKLHITGQEYITNDSKYLFIMNHASFFDIHAVMYIKPDMTWMAKKELWSMPLIGAGVRASGSIPVDRVNFAASMENLHKVVEEAKPGFALGIFPEGTRTKNGKIQTFKRGFVRVLRNSGLRIIPVTLNGFFEFKPKNRWTFHKVPKLELIIHKPLDYSELESLSDQEIIEKVKGIIEKDYDYK